MNTQRKVVITTTYNEMGIIIDTKVEEVAQPETNCSEFPNNWIPCSERLPNKFEDVWVTDNRGRVAVCHRGHSGWRDAESDDWMYYLDSIVAWMPYYVPEPYRAERREDEND